ncbi:MAG: DUF438 domain-containing protein [Longimicrobiales bacterium]
MKNTKQEKTEALKSIIHGLHEGLSPREARARFDELVQDVSPQEIGAMEETLIREGMPASEIQNLCDLHLSVVRGSLEQQIPREVPPGHPVHTYRAANEGILQVANRLGGLCSGLASGNGDASGWREAMAKALEEISGVHLHYLRKENELFPALERHGISGPPQVMWGVHDQIRGQLKAARESLSSDPAEAASLGAALARSVTEMAFKEDKILLPMALEKLSREEWARIRRGEDELGYAFAEPAGPFPDPASHEDTQGASVRAPERTPGRGSGSGMSLPIVSAAEPAPLPESEEAYLDLGTGRLSLQQVDMILRHLPVDLSFVDADGFVRYYSETPDRLFPRTPGAIGRHVTNCHPPKSVHMVEEILRAFEVGERDVAEFWIRMGERFIHIRYFAVRNPEEKYLGCLEVSQDVTAIRGLEGERRLLEWS